MVWIQREIRLPAVKRGCHLVTKSIESEIAQDLRQLKCGLCHIFSECAALGTVTSVSDISSLFV